jgi:hypothetical protein
MNYTQGHLRHACVSEALRLLLSPQTARFNRSYIRSKSV